MPDIYGGGTGSGSIRLDTKTAVTVPATGLTDLATIKNTSSTLLCFHFDVATQALDDFDVFVRAHNSAQLQNITPADWTILGTGTRFLHASGNLAAIAAAGNGYLEMDISGLVEVVVRVSAAVNNALVTSYWSLQ